MNSFILKALGIGIRTVEQAIKVIGTDEENVIQFDKNYYWDKQWCFRIEIWRRK